MYGITTEMIVLCFPHPIWFSWLQWYWSVGYEIIIHG